MRCPRCAQDNPAQAKFCLECGLRLVGGIDLRDTAPEAYTPAHLAEKILTTREALEGERKQVTVLFADLKGSMELLADRDPEEARKILDPVLERMMEAVHQYEGTVNQVMGDGIMALFGAPLAHEDHAVRACYAALRMQETVGAYGDEMQRAYGVPLQIRVGLNSGEVVVRAIGSDLRMDYSAVGPSTHLAARMEQIAKPGTTLATADTARLAEGYVDVKPLGPMIVKGLDAPLDVYQVAGVGALRSRLQVSAARGLSRFVGRERELAVMRAALNDARDRRGRVIGLVGAAGVGKSRLFWEFLRTRDCQDCVVLESRAVSYRRATAYAPIVELLRAYFQIDNRDDGRKIREKIIGKLLALDRALEDDLPAFLSVLDVSFEDAEWEALEPARRRQRILESDRRLFFRESQVQPVIIVIEDLHWMDTESQALLDGAIKALASARILLLLNYRPEFRPAWRGQANFAELVVEPLPPESAGALLETLIGDDPSIDTLKPLLVERAEGNPFFLEESVRALVETRALTGRRGAYRLVTALPSIQVPPTVQAILAARIDRLPPPEKRLLQAASVVGKDVPVRLLSTIADMPQDALRHALDHLQAADFLHESQLFPDVEYAFKHALTLDVAYGSLLHDRRRALHAQIAEVMEWSCGDRVCEQIDRIAYHALQGELWEKALDYSRQAAARAAERSAHQEAVAALEQALVALERLAEHRDTRREAIDLRLELRHSLLSVGQHQRLLGILVEAERLADALGDERRLAAVAAFSTNGFYLVGEHRRAIEAGQRGLTLAMKLDDAGLRATANFYLAQALHALGDYQAAADHLRWNVETFAAGVLVSDDARAARLVIFSHEWLGLCLAAVGALDEGLGLVETAVTLGDAAGSAEIMAGVRMGVGLIDMQRREVPRAIEALSRALALCEGIDTPLLRYFISGYLGHAYALAGRVDEGIELMESSSRMIEALGVVALHPLRLVWLGDGYRRAGRLDEAEALATRAMTLARERDERGHESMALALEAAVAVQREPPDVARAAPACRAALEIAEKGAMRPLAARCHLGLGVMYRRAGNVAQAREHLRIAEERFRALRLPRWLELVDAELNALA